MSTTVSSLENEVKALVDKRNKALEALQVQRLTDVEWYLLRDAFIDADVEMKRAMRRLENLVAFEKGRK